MPPPLGGSGRGPDQIAGITVRLGAIWGLAADRLGDLIGAGLLAEPLVREGRWP